MITELQSLNLNILAHKGVNNTCRLKCRPYFLREKHFLKYSILENFSPDSSVDGICDVSCVKSA